MVPPGRYSWSLLLAPLEPAGGGSAAERARQAWRALL